MESKFGSRRKPSSGRGIVLAAIAAFIAGGALVGWVVWYNFQPARNGAAQPDSAVVAEVSASPTALPSAPSSASPSPLSEPVTPENAEQAVEAVTRVAEQQGGLDQRLAAAEQRLTQLDLQAQAAAGNAARAESLLIAFATRRAVERGAELGYLADQLRLRFGDQWPNAVSTIITFSRDPVRLDGLVARLEGLGPTLRESGQGPSWGAFKREMSQLFVFRRESTPSPQPQRRLERARWALEQGRYQNAIDEVKGMPGADQAESWIKDAERYAKAMEALEVIETAAVLDQRGLRDGAGNPVRQVSPLVVGS
ncbi:hypothetical protein [Erythrobacter dokdonensis]|uniref:Uncharacterized protein n=1 Tax=Erythrobacter dokdonensis DSW-74 TaxID=1300349 RepID=A0A1A7BHG3_9SPHN|nr:hypothetical protein [Erythrobacter dokdonensis]OBV11993.1 hypothetical protein I603_0124 [Erythrobacter dokdonensis DSW-74]